MNYQNYSSYDQRPPLHGRPREEVYDIGQGTPVIEGNNMTVQDIFRTPFLMTQDHHKNYNEMAKNALKGIASESDLSRLYFSDENMKRIQKMIKQEIKKQTKGKFILETDQDPRDLFILMRSVYMEQARFLPNEIVRQVKRLNKRVVDEAVPGMITEIKQYYGYLKEINKPLTPIPRPMNVGNAGRRILPSATTSFGYQ